MDILTRLREAVRSRKGPRYQPVGFEGVNAAWKNRGSPRVRYAVLGVGTIVVLGFVLLIVSLLFISCLRSNNQGERE